MENEKLVVKEITVDKAISKGLAQLNLGSHDVDIKIISEGKKGLFGFGQKDAVVEITPKQLPEMREPGNIAVFENEEREDYISEHMEEENLNNEEDGYDYTETVEYAGQADNESRVAVVADTLVDVEYEDDEFEDDLLDEEDETDGSSRKETMAYIVEYLTNTVEVYGADATVTTEESKNAITFHIDTNKPGLIIGKHGKIVNALQTLAQTIYQQRERRRVSVVVNVGDYRERRANILENIADRTAERVLRTKQPVFLEPLPAFERKQIHARLSRNERIKTHSEGKEPHRYLVVEIAE
ncbi:RNA-binding cell elongation regulator Jag/EloR [Jeotgalibaca caeni]|uniref:RNA-binding cell elongation regulator Jag/EloR n=1 Tax=Jeotgalibaca caeni TaxID=3028623 RepID=UPI00237E315B|nr:RNA-binding cell elongation regulator Jag/EloR [Jeotgalibaca caeni]MDE1548310.1 Jag N-terminal domain-containing protein [Jeotgalibaca caeni]